MRDGGFYVGAVNKRSTEAAITECEYDHFLWLSRMYELKCQRFRAYKQPVRAFGAMEVY